MNPSMHSGLVSIIVPCFNQREFTRLCLQALFRHTRLAWELIVINNGSTDGTGDYLAGVQDAAAVPVTVITNVQNRGFPAAVNQGLNVASGEYLVLLNNDAVVTDGWLDQLIALTRADPAIGLVGPMSNYATPPQLVADVSYRDLEEMRAFARRWREEHRGKWFTVPKLSGFCVLMNRAVYETIGGLDPRFGLGLFDDDDLAVRARRAGFELAVAHDLFIHHFGSRTFVGNGIDAGALLEENARRFAAKWGRDVPMGRRVALQPWGRNPEFHAETQSDDAKRAENEGMSQGRHSADRRPSSRPDPHSGQTRPRVPTGQEDRSVSADSAVPSLRLCVKLSPRPRVSLTMIVRNEEMNLSASLGSVRGLFDEVVVVDTGSTDRTKEIAGEFGAHVFEFPWIDDFAAARNAALSHATGDYAFWLDADDVLDPPQREKLAALLDGLRPNDEAAYVVRCACDPAPDGSGGETVVDHIRLFPLRDDVRWTYRVHEQILPALRRVNVPVRWTDLTVRHTGYTDPAVRARKLQRDTQILLTELAERPEDPFVLFNLGAIAIERKDWTKALGHLQASLARSAPSDSITRKLFALIARAHQMLGDSAAALRTCAEGLSLDPEDAELWFRQAVVHRHRGESARAEACWRRILTLRRPDQFCSVDQGIYGHLTRRNLAVLAAERGDAIEVERLWSEVLGECPGDREALAALRRCRAVPPVSPGGP